MIHARRLPSLSDIGGHYDELDRFYREMWGEHVHHGLWLSGRETPEQAARQMVCYIARIAGIKPRDRVCDVGSGYGASARALVECYGARVTAVTLSRSQHVFALSKRHHQDNPAYLCGDWLKVDLEANAYDQVIAIESTEHMVDKAAMCRRAASLLRPGGRLIICAWLAADHLGRWPNRILLEAICDEGRMPGMGSEQDYRNWITAAGFSLVRFEDLTRQVRKTWSVCTRRFAWALLTRRDYRRYLLDQRNRNRAFAMTLFRILLAYWLGAMRYGVFCATLRR